MSDYDLQHDSIASLEATCLASMPRKMHVHAYCWLSLDLEKTSDYRNVKRNNIYLIYKPSSPVTTIMYHSVKDVFGKMSLMTSVHHIILPCGMATHHCVV